METRICSKCRIEKTFDNFYKNSSKKLGIDYQCKECCKESKKIYNSKPETRELRRANGYIIRKREDVKKYQREYKRKYSNDKHEIIKYKARQEVKKAVLNNILEKESVCSLCYSDKFRIEAHHEDYSKPLDVIWCCSRCHADIHYGRININGKPSKQFKNKRSKKS